MNLGRNQVILEFITAKKGNSGHSQTCTLDFRKTDFSKVHKKAGMIPWQETLKGNTRAKRVKKILFKGT